jgi:hypothetical protein
MHLLLHLLHLLKLFKLFKLWQGLSTDPVLQLCAMQQQQLYER